MSIYKTDLGEKFSIHQEKLKLPLEFEKICEKKASLKNDICNGSIEIDYVKKGGSNMNGMIGATFTSNKSSSLIISLDKALLTQKISTSDLISSVIDDTYYGLTDEILNDLIKIFKNDSFSELGSGHLFIYKVGYGVMGSSFLAFKRILELLKQAILGENFEKRFQLWS